MRFRWKKEKSTRISQLVKDHLQKRRGDSSFVVETGFPTSLVDLFIKNREKLKKSKRHSVPLNYVDDPPTPFHSPPQSPLVTPTSPSSILPFPPCNGVNDRFERGHGMAILAVVNFFFLIVLALATKRLLTLGITIFAFLLFFLEFMWKHLKPSLKAKGYLIWLPYKEHSVDGNKLSLKVQREEFLQPECYSPKSCDSRYLFQETEIEYEEIQSERSINKLKDFVLEKEVELKRKSWKDTLNLKMKIFVSKRLRRTTARKEHNH